MARANWTVMVLMGANNLPDEGDLTDSAKSDLREMEKVGSKESVLNIVVQIDQKEQAGGPQRFYIRKRGEGGKQLLDGPGNRIPPGQGSSGDPNVLEYFITWAKRKCPAEHYLLVIWGHAYRFAFTRDGDKKDALDFTKLASVLKKTGRVDVVGFDACSAGWIEAVYQLRDSADFLVASQFAEPLPGWPYDRILQKPHDDAKMGPEDFGRAIISQFVRHYAEEASVTMTMLDLRQGLDVVDKVRDLADELVRSVQNDRVELNRVKTMLQRTLIREGQHGVDLVTFCWNLTNYSGYEKLRRAATNLGDLLVGPKNPLIMEHAESDLNVAMLRGVNILAPNPEGGFDCRELRPLYSAFDLAKETSWDELVFALAEPD